MDALHIRLAAILLVGFACSGEEPGVVGEPGLVSVQFATHEGYVINASAIFLDRDDSVVAIERTDSQGRASAVMNPGGSLVVVWLRRGGERISSEVHYYLGVKPGDDIQIGGPWEGRSAPRVDVLLPTAPPNAVYRVRARCGGGSANGPRFQMNRLAGCDAGDLFVTSGSSVIPFEDYGSFLVRDVDFTGDIDLSAESFVPASLTTQTLLNTLEPMEIATSWMSVRDRSGWLSTMNRGSSTSYLGALHPTATKTTRIPPIETDQLLVDTTLFGELGGPVTTRRVIESVAFTTEYSLDVATIDIPFVLEDASLDARGDISWREGPGEAEWVRAHIVTMRDVDTINRYMRAPHQGRSRLALPQLPEEYAWYNPLDGDDNHTRFFVLGTAPGGYDTVRQLNYADGYLEYVLGRGPEHETVRAIGDRFVTSSFDY